MSTVLLEHLKRDIEHAKDTSDGLVYVSPETLQKLIAVAEAAQRYMMDAKDGLTDNAAVTLCKALSNITKAGVGE